MAHLVIIPDSVVSKLLTTAELARRLERAGHRVTLIGALDAPPALDGLSYTKLDLRLKAPNDATPAAGVRRRRLFQRRRRIDAAVAAAAAAVPAFEALLRRLAPDLLLIDIECHEYVIAARRLDVKVALISVFFNLWRRGGCPPLSSALDPRRGELAVKAAWLELAWSKRLRRLKSSLLGEDPDRYSLLAAYARSLGFCLDQVDRNHWLIPFVYRNVPVLTLNLQELDYPHRPHPDSRYVGPQVRCREGSEATDLGGKESQRLARLIAERRARGRQARLIYASFGAMSSVDGVRFWSTIARAAAPESDWIVILGLGGVVPSADLGSLPSNVHAFDWADQTRILEHADCAVIHGGMTSVYECLHAGVPIVACPFRINDQLGTAARVAYHGLGLVVDRRHDDAPAIARAIRLVMTDGAFRQRVDAMRRRMAQIETEQPAIRAVQELLERPGERTPEGWASLRRSTVDTI